MHGVGTGLARDPEDFLDVEIGAYGPAVNADAVRFVGLEAMQRELVLLGEYRHAGLAHFVRRAEHPNGDFPAVGDKNLREFGQRRLPVRLPALRSRAHRRSRQYIVEGFLDMGSGRAGYRLGPVARSRITPCRIDTQRSIPHSRTGGSPDGSGKELGD